MQAELPARPGAAGVPVCIAIADGRARSIDGEVRIGRDETCELVVHDKAASRVHALVAARADGTVVITDQNSRNGMFVDGRKVSVAEVRQAAILRVGDSVIRIATLADEPVTASDAGPLVGGTALTPTRRTLGLVAPTNLAVLILGETGTGKEVLATAVHEASGRKGPFVAVNCAALPDHLIESELFGHARGAFTGAGTQRRGLFAEAAGGTLFLDEIGELPLAVQAKLLRALETKSVRSVGSDRETEIDVRIVSATNRDLHASASRGEFRPDLLARLAAVELRLPPLRDRVEDLPALIAFLWRRAQGSSAIAAPTVTANALEAMAIYEWPHNIRELDHVLRAAALTDASTLDLEALPERIQALLRERRASVLTAAIEPPPTTAPAIRSVPIYEQREQVERALREHGGNVRSVARSLGIARGHLYRVLKRWNLDPATFRTSDTPIE